jgi:uncharacterized membrane protein YbhN (UPF0104 family)
MPDHRSRAGRHVPVRWAALGQLAALGVAALAISQLSALPARVLAACLGWAAVAGVLELLSIAGFLLAFKLVFGGHMTWRQSLPAGLRGLAASTLLPAGGLIGPAAAARAALPHDSSFRETTRSAIAFLILTTAPGVVALGGLGLLLWEGGAAGPHTAVLTLVPAGIALALVLATWLIRDSSAEAPAAGQPATLAGSGCDSRDKHTRPIRGGAAEARRLITSLHWQLVGAVAYYAFDNAVLWATFHAYGPAPPLSIIMMGYLVGSLTGVLPLPAGLGIAEGGMIGALVLYGSPAAPAAGAVLLYRAVSLSLPVILGAVAWRGGISRVRRRRPIGSTDAAA